jgi:hypothetical protein
MFLCDTLDLVRSLPGVQPVWLTCRPDEAYFRTYSDLELIARRKKPGRT